MADTYLMEKDIVPGAKRIFVCFTGLAKKMGMKIFEWKKTMSQVGGSKAYLYDNNLSWYSYKDEELHDLLKSLNLKSYNNVVFLGSSAGGSAAMKYGTMYEVDRVEAFGPQTLLSDKKGCINDWRWEEHRQKLINQNIFEPYDIPEYLWSRNEEHKTIYNVRFSMSNYYDTANAAVVSIYQNVHIHPYQHHKHNVARFLKKHGKLLDVIKGKI